MSKFYDLLVLVLLGIAATILTVSLHLSFTLSTVLYLVIPSVYLAARLQNRKPWKRIAVMSLLFGGLYGFAFAYIADWNHAWAWPTESLPFGLWFGILNPIEWLWVFFWITYIVLFYERFIDHDTDDKVSPHVVWAFLPVLLILGAITWFSLAHPLLLTWPYAYAVLAILTLPPAFFLAKFRPHVVPKIALSALFFVPLHFAHEISGLWTKQWEFPGQYFVLVPLPGSVFVPIEEFTVWILLGSILVLSYYELYIDDGR